MILQLRFLFLIAWAMLSLSCASSNTNTKAAAAFSPHQIQNAPQNQTSLASPQIALSHTAKQVPKAVDDKLIIPQGLSLQESAGFPTQINAIVSSNDCRSVVEVLHEQIEHEFQIQLRSDENHPQHSACAQQHIIPLPLMGLKAGAYTVKINGLEKTFELYQEQIAAPPQLHG